MSHATCGRDQIMKLLYAKLRYVLVKLYCKMKGKMRQSNFPSGLIFQNPSVCQWNWVPFFFLFSLSLLSSSLTSITQILWFMGAPPIIGLWCSFCFVRASCSYISAR